VSGFRGFLNHSNIETTPQYKHYDFITKQAWDNMVTGGQEDDLPYSHEDLIARSQDGFKRALDEEAVQGQIKILVAAGVIGALKDPAVLKALRQALKDDQ
jgi:hypothetical protein